MADTRPLNFVWRRTTLDALLEGYFIKEVLLADLGRPVRMVPLEDDQPIALGPDTLLGTFHTEMAPILKKARAQGIPNIGLFHIGDEEGKDDLGFYADADYVIRNYWIPAAMISRSRSLGVIWAPNGYRTGIGPIDPVHHLKVSERETIGFFAGVLTGRALVAERDAMVENIRAASLPFRVVATPSFGQGLGPTPYAAWLCNSRFAPVPAGHSHETIRLYDALEAGAIPIMVRSPFVEEIGALGALGEPPFILLDSWNDLASAYAPFAHTNDPNTIRALEELRQRVAHWWTAFKRHEQKKIAGFINGAFRAAGR